MVYNTRCLGSVELYPSPRRKPPPRPTACHRHPDQYSAIVGEHSPNRGKQCTGSATCSKNGASSPSRSDPQAPCASPLAPAPPARLPCLSRGRVGADEVPITQQMEQEQVFPLTATDIKDAVSGPNPAFLAHDGPRPTPPSEIDLRVQPQCERTRASDVATAAGAPGLVRRSYSNGPSRSAQRDRAERYRSAANRRCDIRGR